MEFRPITLPDNEAYVEWYKNSNYIVTSFTKGLSLNQEIGFFYLLKFLRGIFGNNYQFFFITLAIINSVLMYFGSKSIIKNTYHNNSIYSIEGKISGRFIFLPLFILYLSYYGYMYNLVVLRAGIALSLLYFSVSLLLNNKRFYGILFFFISLLFHQTAILGLFVILVSFISTNISKKKYLTILFILLILYIFQISKFMSTIDFNSLLGFSNKKNENIFGSYLANESAYGGYSFRTAVFLINTGVIILINSKNFVVRKLLNIVLFGVTLLVIFGSIQAFERATDFFIIFSFILYYLTLNGMQNLQKKYSFFIWIVITETIFFMRLVGLL